jgi:D-glycero-D-manno-heptose 1,7-bisphosphate phosphatase
MSKAISVVIPFRYYRPENAWQKFNMKWRRPWHIKADKRLRYCLHSLIRQTLPRRDYEIIVVDLGSRPPIEEWVRSVDPEIRVIRSDESGAFNEGHAKNIGIRAADAERVLTTNADVLASPNFLEVVLQGMTPGYYGACQNFRAPWEYHYRCEDPVADISRWAMDPKVKYASRVNVGNCQVLYKRDWESLRGFDEDYLGWGRVDEDLFYRARALGLKERWFDNQTSIFHLEHHKDDRSRKRDAKRNNKIADKKYRELQTPIRNRDRSWGMVYDQGRTRHVVFMDRDGVINKSPEGDGYVKSWDGFEFLPNAIEGIRQLWDSGCAIHVISNQAGVGKGLMTEEALQDINAQLLQKIESKGIMISNLLCCTHTDKEKCLCRKPRTGSFYRALKNLDRPPERMFMIGDSARDIEAGKQFGCDTIAVLSGKSDQQEIDGWRVKPDQTFGDLLQAAHWISDEVSS